MFLFLEAATGGVLWKKEKGCSQKFRNIHKKVTGLQL